MRGIRTAERAEAVAAGTVERDAVPMAADRTVRDVQPSPVDRNEPIDLPLQALTEQRFHAPEIPEALFADVGHERDRARRLHPGPLQRAHDRDEHGQAATVVADARPAQLAPTRDTFTFVSSGNTVSRCEAMTR